MKFPYRVLVEIEGRQFCHQDFDGREKSRAEYFEITRAVKRLFDLGNINSYHVAVVPLPWIG